MKHFSAIPFTTENESGLVTARGIAKFSQAGIVLEFKKNLLGLVPLGDKEVRVPLANILDVKFLKGIFKFGPTIEIQTNSVGTHCEMPNQNGLIVLKILRADFERACEAVDMIQGHMKGQI